MDLASIVLLLTAGLAAGVVNGIAGGGSLITFPTLMLMGLPPIAANVTNSVAVFPGLAGTVAGSYPDLQDLVGRRGWRPFLLLVPTVVAGTLAGCGLLLVTPPRAFDLIVPFLVLGAGAVLAFRERLQVLVGHPARLTPRRRVLTMHAVIGLITIYGGYFGAAMGILMVSGLALVLDDRLVRIIALKNAVSALCGFTTVIAFGIFGPVHWTHAACIVPSTILGGYLGARLARRLPAGVLRVVIVTFAGTVGSYLLWRAIRP
ncbi:MAG: sulfite exporter TauE/SafE family protein [Dactylosporangium sp.]|nr:sulfite exporter TauE/SafE family protein [Dactylosporangium sp.]NNJ62910.1 sulfite exporter TauE/SafE family protein [Dactylosporangium sp.]